MDTRRDCCCCCLCLHPARSYVPVSMTKLLFGWCGQCALRTVRVSNNFFKTIYSFPFPPSPCLTIPTSSPYCFCFRCNEKQDSASVTHRPASCIWWYLVA
uniref:Putative secreted protein n=1 Tax=Anopheles darlingi TaxID=43151 RepID=A0A2M4DFZ6_ANODA